MNKKVLGLSGVRLAVSSILAVAFFILLFSQPLFALVVRDGLGPDQAYSFFEDRVECNWDHVQADLLRYEVALGTTAGGTDVVGWTDVGLAEDHTFTGISIASGTTYYSSVRAIDTQGAVQDQGSSNGFLARHDQVLTDTSELMFFNNARVLDMIDLTTDVNSARPKTFSGDGGGYWKYKVPVTVTEPGVTERINAPCRIQLSVPSGQMGNVREIRVTDDHGNELPRYNLNTSTTAPDIVFLVNMQKGETRTYWVYWGNSSATDPAYGFTNSATQTSMYEWTPYYSRKNLPAGMEMVPLTYAYSYKDDNSNPGWNEEFEYYGSPWTNGAYYYWRDDARSNTFTFFGSPFYFFGQPVNTWRVNINGFLYVNCSPSYIWYYCGSGSNSTDEKQFRGASTRWQYVIMPMWADLKYDDPNYPQNPGVWRDDLSSPPRVVFTWRCNTWSSQDDIYIFQTIVYQTGDIAHRYGYLSYRSIVGGGGAPDPVVNIALTAGISFSDDNHWLRNTPLKVGIAKSPTAFYQCADAFRGYYTVGTIVGPSGGYSETSHIESMVFDSTVSNPDWQTLFYDCTGGGGSLDIYVRTGSTPLPDLGGWGAWTSLVTGATANGSIAIPAGVADLRYIQYKVVFKKNGAADIPVLNEIRFVYGGISVDEVHANEPNGVSQGQDNIPVQVDIRNFYSAAVSLQSTDLSFTLGSYTYSLVSPALPASIPAGGTITANFLVNVLDDSPVGTATVDAAATASAIFSDNDAQTPYIWQVKRKANLSITKVETTPTHVNKGQNGIPVRIYMTNLGEVPYSFDGATLTFSLGTYTQSIVSPALGTVINPGESFIATLSVNVLANNPSGVSIIDATASGTNTFSNKITDDYNSDVTDSWTIQNPANMILEEVTASSTVYRGQVNTPVFLRVSNQGEAIANWESSDLLSHFTLGTYDSVYPVSSLPIQIPGGLEVTGRYGVDISPTSATGNSDVDADISGTDNNTLFPISYPSALLPASWTILAEKVTTYKDASFLNQSSSFNRPSAGNTYVYAKGTNLLPSGEFVVRWLDPSSNEVASSAILTADASGTLSAEYQLTSTSTYGTWKVQITNPIGTVVSCENLFDVVSPASLTIDVKLPDYVSVGQPFVGSLTYINSGGAVINSANPSPVDPSGPGIATITSGPNPSVSTVAGNGQATTTWDFVAQSAGNYTASLTAYGFDANSGDALTSPSVTSNICVIQNPPVVSVTSINTTPTIVYLNQKNLTVTANVRNTGEASAMIDVASLAFTLGGYVQNLTSPSLPFELAGGANVTLTFDVAVNATSATGLSDISANVKWYDKNWPASSTFINGLNPHDSWTVNQVGFILSSNDAFSPEQANFNQGQTVYFRAYGLNPNSSFYRIRLYNSHIPQAGTAPTGWQNVSPPLGADADGYVDYLWTLPSNATIGEWSVEIEDDADVKGSTRGNLLGLQYFKVQRPGNLVASMSISPASVFKGENFTITLIASNTQVNGSTIVNATASPLIKYPSATGDAIYLSGPTPASYTIDALTQQEFTWAYQATQDTGLVGSYSVTASLTFSLSGLDANTGSLVTSNVSVSSPLIIYGRGVELSSTTLDFGSILCGDAVISNSSAVNTGNYPLDDVRWIVTDLNGGGTNKISKANLTMSPAPIGSIAAGSSVPASGTLWVPYNQPADTYIATMSIYNDRNGNSSFDIDEVYDLFQTKVVVPPCKRVFTVEPLIDLEGWTLGETTTVKNLNVFSGGNLPLDNLKFKQILGTNTFPISVTPQNYGPLATTGAFTASVSANITSGPNGNYIATWTIWNDFDNDNNVDATEASNTFQVWVQVGNKSFTVLPDPVDAGTGTPSTVLSGFGPTLTNTGDLDLRHIKAIFMPLSDGVGNTIASDGIGINPALAMPINPGDTSTVNLRLFIPAGQPSGTYTATQYMYEDSNENGIMDPGEASASFDLTVFVPLVRLVQVLQSTVSLGGVAPGTTRTVSFPCRNIGNVDLTALRWEKTNLQDGSGNTIPVAQLSFPPTEPFSAPAGQFFNHDIQISVPLGQAYGDYLSISPNYWLYEDYNPANAARDIGAEPDSNFKVACQVGEQKLDVIEASLSGVGDPNGNTATVTYNVKNIGTLILNNPKATGTVFVPSIAGPIDIPANANAFTPVSLGNISVNQTVQGQWSVNIPAGASATTYVATLTVWEDANNNGIIDGAEASDTCQLNLTVNSKKVIDVIQTQLDLGWAGENSVTKGVIEIYNAGNLDLTDVTELSADISNGFATIPAASITFTLNPTGPLAIGNSALATVTVTVGSPQADGTYTGDQKVYDDYNPANGTWDAAEEFDTFELLLRIGRQYLYETNTANPPVVFGNRDPGSVQTQSFTVFDGNSVPLSKISWLNVSQFTDGANTIPLASLTFLPATTFSIPGGGNQPCTANVDLAPDVLAGNYVATATVWEDNNLDSIVQNTEASATFQLTLTVNSLADLDILLANVDFGTIVRGSTVAVEIGFQSIGNVDLTGFNWTFSDLNGPGVLASTNFTASPTYIPDPVTPGAYATTTVYLTVPRLQLTGAYGPDGPQLLMDGTTASDTATFQCNIVGRSLYEQAVGNPDVAFGAQNPGSTYEQGLTVYNGTIAELQNVKWTVVSQFTDGTNTIPAASLTFSPNPIASIAGSGNQISTASVEVGPFQVPGNYVATATVWEDDDNDGIVDSDEASATFQLTLTVNPFQDLDILSSNIDFGSVLKGATTSVEIGFQNIGNVDITGFSWTFSDLNGPAILSSTNFMASPTYIPDPVTPSSYATATVYLTIPRTQLSGVYGPDGPQLLVDGTTASDTCTFSCTVLPRSLYEQAVGNPDVAFGANAPGTIAVQNFTVFNGTAIELQNIKWTVVSQFADGANTIPAASLTFSPSPIATIAGSGSEACSATVDIGPYQLPGNYVATATVWEDDNNDGVVNADEASATFQLTVTVNAFQDLDILSSNIDFGSVLKGATTSVEIGFQNIGNVNLTGFNWTFANLNGPAVLTSTNFTASPTYVPDPVTPGSYATATVYLTIPRTQLSGIYGPDGPQLLVDSGTASDTCTFSCTVLPRSLYEQAVGNPDVAFGAHKPGATYNQNFTLFNGTVVPLANVKWAVVSQFTDGANTIPAASLTFTPNPIANIAGGGNQISTANVEVGSAQAPGSYVATATVWEDDNNNGSVDADEAVAVFQLTLTVNSFADLDILSANYDFGNIYKGDTASVEICFRNIGNVDLTGFNWTFANLNGPAVLASTNFMASPTYVPDPVTPGSYATTTVYLSIPRTQLSGAYGPGGPQLLVDSTTASDTCTFSCTVLQHLLYEQAVGNPDIAFGSQDPGATYINNFNVINGTTSNLQNVKWKIVNQFDDGIGNTIPTASLTFSPTPIASIAGSSNQACNATVVVGPYQAPADYVATATVWEDDDNDGVVDSDEASATFQLTLTVNAIYAIDIIPTEIDFGQIQQGAIGNADVSFQNIGNAPINASQLSWAFAALNNPTPAQIPSTDISCSVPSTVDPVVGGAFSTSTVQISVGSSQIAGIYGPDGPQTLTVSVAGSPNDSCNFKCEVISGNSGLNLSPGTVYQPIATSTFDPVNYPAPNDRYVLSAWVCPGTGSAKIGFIQTDVDGNPTATISVDINPSGQLTFGGDMPAIDYGVTNTAPFKDPDTGEEFTYYRVFLTFDLTYDPLVASSTSVILQNSTPDNTASYTTWFDGIQLERAIKPSMTKPTSYRPYDKIVSPNQEQSVEGGSSYYEW